MIQQHKTFAILLIFAVCPILLSGSLFAQQATSEHDEFDTVRTVNILQEPRHRTVFSNGQLRLLDVQINPGDKTLPHTHDSAIHYTFISNGQGPLNGRVSSTTSYVEEHYTHRVTNEGPGLFRIIALANYGAPVSDEAPAVSGLSAQPQLENAWFRTFRLELSAGEETTVLTHVYPVAIIQVSDGLLHITRGDGITNELHAAGDWAWRDVGQTYRILNKSDRSVSVIINEGKR